MCGAAVMMVSSFPGSLSACNTVKGAGQDIKAAGQAIERKAEQKKHY